MKITFKKITLILLVLSLVAGCKQEEVLSEEAQPSQTETLPHAPATDPQPDLNTENPDESLTLVNPALPEISGATTLVNLQGFSDTSYDSAEFYFDSLCAVSVDQANQNQMTNGGIDISVVTHATTEIYASLFRNGVSSGCELVLTYTHDTVAPQSPTSVQVNSSQATQTQSVTVFGITDLDVVNVILFSDASCVSQVGTGSRDEFTSGVQFYSVDWNQETVIYGQVVDGAGNSSGCSEYARFDISI